MSIILQTVSKKLLLSTWADHQVELDQLGTKEKLKAYETFNEIFFKNK
jgi:hypothetical protein